MTTRVRPFADLIGAIVGSARLCAPLPDRSACPWSSRRSVIVPQVDDEVFHGVLLWVVVPAATLAFAVSAVCITRIAW